jgi:nicotinamide riboside transporter PnuC
MKSSDFLEWGGVITAISYTILIALNVGAELIAFSLLFISAILIALWSFRGNHKGILILQLFYATAAILGFFRWLS